MATDPAIEERLQQLPAEERDARRKLLQLVEQAMMDEPAAAIRSYLDPAPVHGRVAARLRNRARVAAVADALRRSSRSAHDVQAALGGVSRQALAQRRKARRLLAVPVPLTRELVYPEWQFVEDQPRRELPRLLAAADAHLSPLALHQLLTVERDDGSRLVELLDDLLADRVDELVTIIAAGQDHGS